MSYVDNKHEKSYVVTYKELLFAFVAFCVILFVLYPKDMLKEQILSEKSNYDLSMLYLKNLIEHDQENEELMLILAEQSLRTGNKDLSLRLLELILRSENDEYRDRAVLLTYDLKKDDYFYFKGEDKKRVEKEKLRRMFVDIIRDKIYLESDSDKWYDEAVFHQDYKAMYLFIDVKLLKEPDNLELLKQAYYTSIELSHRADSLKYIDLLAQKDTEDGEKWLEAEYYMLISYALFKEANLLLEKHENDSVEWKNRYADFKLMRKNYIKANSLYMELFNSTKAYTQKKKYFYDAVNALLAGEYSKEASNLARKYEKRYLGDKEARKYLLKLYMATGRLDYAASLSSKILKKEIR